MLPIVARNTYAILIPVNETRKYLDHHARTTADNITATVETRNDDGTYMVRTIAGKALRRAGKSNPTDEFAIGSRVIIAEPANTRNVIGSQPVILSRAPREQRGLSATTPSESRTGVSRAVITTVDPDPLILIAGGDAGEQVITGFGFTEAASYVDREGAAVVLDNESAPIVTATKITMHVAAPSDAEPGEYAVATSGARARTGLVIQPFSGADVEPSLFVWTYVEPAAPRLLQFNADTLAPMGEVLVLTGAIYAGALMQAGEILFGFGQQSFGGGATRMRVRVNLLTGEVSAFDTAPDGPFGLGSAGVGAELWAPLTPSGGIATVSRFGADGVILGTVALPSSGQFSFLATDDEGEYVWHADTLIALAHNVDAGTTLSFDAIPSDVLSPLSDTTAVTPTGIWKVSRDGAVMKLHRTSLALLIRAEIGLDSANREIGYAGGKVFVAFQVFGSSDVMVFVVNDATGVFAQVALIVNFDLNWLHASEDAIYLTSESSGTLYRVDAETYAVTSVVIDPAPLGLGPAFVSRRVR